MGNVLRDCLNQENIRREHNDKRALLRDIHEEVPQGNKGAQENNKKYIFQMN